MGSKTAVATLKLGEQFWIVNPAGKLTHAYFETYARWEAGYGRQVAPKNDQLWLQKAASVLHNGPYQPEQKVAAGAVVLVEGIGKVRILQDSHRNLTMEGVDAPAKKKLAATKKAIAAEETNRVTKCQAERGQAGHACMVCRPEYCMA